jgi:ABC-type bacteriocin/lantibiotic exporter with double-glycine peptidase domain
MRLVMDGALGDLRWVKITRGEGLFRRVFGAKSSAYTDALAKDRALTLISGYAADMAIVSSILVLFTYFMTLGGGSDTLFASFALFAAAALRLFPALYRVISLSHSLSTHAPDLGQVVENLKGTLPPLEVEILNAPQNPPFHESLAFQDVSFRYPGQNRNILSDVNLILNAGDRVVIGGASGSGKSTLLSIILGLLNPDEGRVLLDGTETPVLNAIRNASVALVSQDPFISTGTVGDNIAFPHPAASLDIEKAQTLLVALGLDWSLDRQVGENGIHLSGGERQRLALTRALYLSPMFLVLDEATSQMDEVTACRAYELVFETCPNATVLLCTHQKHPNAFCSRHLKVEAGVINDLSL